jgi:hypothetical protein
MTLIPGMSEHGLQMHGSTGPAGSSGGLASRDNGTSSVPPSSVLPSYFSPSAASHSDVINVYPSLQGPEATSPTSLSSSSTSGPLYVPTTHTPMGLHQNSVLPYPSTPQRSSGVGTSPWPVTSDCGSGYSPYNSSVPSQAYPSPLTSWYKTEGGITDPLHRPNGLSPFSPYMGNELGSWGNYAQGLSLAGQGLQYSRALGK